MESGEARGAGGETPSGAGGETARAAGGEAARAARYDAGALRRFAIEVLERLGMPADDAAAVGESLVEAEMSGVGPHGMPHLLLNAEKLRKGEARPRPDIRVRQVGPSLFLLDGGGCLGAVAGRRAVTVATQAARETGIGFCLSTNTHTYGFAAHFVRGAAEAGFAAATWCNTSPLMAPWGGTAPLLGTNPIALAVPTGREPVVVLDMACSVRSWGDVVEAARRGRPIPPGWALDDLGRETGDARAALEGSLLPFGDYKGYGLALMVEIMTGYLAGQAATEPIPRATGFTRTPGRSHAMLVLDVGRFVPLDLFRERVDGLIRQIHASPRREGRPEIRVPGEGAARRRKERLASGVPLDEGLVADLRALGREVGVEFCRPLGPR